jgi:hypothetical protein
MTKKTRLSHTNRTKNLPTMTQKSKDWATRTPLKVSQPWCRKLKISGVCVAQYLDFCVMIGRLLVGFVLLNVCFSVSWSLPTMTQKTKDWATRTPLKVYQPWHRKLDWPTRTPLKSTSHDTENKRLSHTSGVCVTLSLDSCVMVGRRLVGFVWLNI